MRGSSRFGRFALASGVASAIVAGATISSSSMLAARAEAQDPNNPGAGAGAGAVADPKARAAGKRVPLRLRAPNREPAGKAARKNADPLGDPNANPANPAANANPANANPANPANPAAANGNQLDPNAPLPPLGTYHYRFKVGTAAQGESVQLAYYPSKEAVGAPAVLLVHERDRSIKDFEEGLRDLKGVSLAEHLQKQGYAVMAVDLRGHGGNARRPLTARDWASTPGDLELAYLALVDRHNRGELNVARLGVVALGEGANVALAWAGGGGGVSSEGRAGDVGALVLVSPMADPQSQGLRAAPPLSNLAARIPMDLMVGERDAGPFGLVDAVKPVVKRHRSNQVEVFPSGLHAFQLLRLEPGLAVSITKFLDSTVKARVDEWEGRYLVDPVRFADKKVFKNQAPPEPDATRKAPQ